MGIKNPRRTAIKIAKELGYSASVIDALSKANIQDLDHILCTARKEEAEKYSERMLSIYYSKTFGQKSTTRRWLI